MREFNGLTSLFSEAPRLSHLRSAQPIDNTRRRGSIYTPEVLANLAASLLSENLPASGSVLLDPACGDGALLKATSRLINGRFIGVDSDPDVSRKVQDNVKGIEFYQRDAFVFLSEMMRGREPHNVSGVIANPPWGAEVNFSRDSLRALGYTLASGQFDSWDLFVEGIVRASLHGATIVLILPDSLFLPEHEPVRQLIASQTRIQLIARLGEGLFPGVYRGTVLLSLTKGSPAKESPVRCFRLTPEDRRAVCNGMLDLVALVRHGCHIVQQSRFLKDVHTRFDIDVKDEEQQRLTVLEKHSFPWHKLTIQGRGVELSKTGMVLTCPHCQAAQPYPRDVTQPKYCSCCRARFTDLTASKKRIIRDLSDKQGPGWMPLIVGEDVIRHYCAPSRQIKLGVPGIRYKNELCASTPKLLVRKTGIGINAAIDKSGSTTNQVVFHFLAKQECHYDLLEYLTGVMCSRIMLACYLKKSGDIEWRSHPYITQKTIMTLPIPNPQDSAAIVQAKGIANAVSLRPYNCDHGHPIDLLIECLVAGLYGMDEHDLQWAIGVLDTAQALEPIRRLRISNKGNLRPIMLRSGSLHETIDVLQRIANGD